MKPIIKSLLLVSSPFLIAVACIFALPFYLSAKDFFHDNSIKVVEKPQWDDGAYSNCVISPNEVVRVRIQDSVILDPNNHEQKVTIFYLDGKAYQGWIDADISGVTFDADLSNDETTYVSFDNKADTCNVQTFNGVPQSIYNKNGLLGVGTSWNDLGLILPLVTHEHKQTTKRNEV